MRYLALHPDGPLGVCILDLQTHRVCPFTDDFHWLLYTARRWNDGHDIPESYGWNTIEARAEVLSIRRLGWV